MKVEILRKWGANQSVAGEMWIDNQFECFTLEPARENPVNQGHPIIPAGTYKVILTPSPHLGYITPEVLDVPGRTEIRWHIGNFPKDTLGCVLVGMNRGHNFVGESKVAFKRLMVLLETANEIEATYKETADATQ